MSNQNYVIDKDLKSKILNEIHSKSLDSLLKLKEKQPNVHWSEVRYEKTGDTILHVASRLGFIECIQSLLNDFFPKLVNVKNKDEKIPLHEAAQFSQYDACKILLQNGAEVNALKRGDWTPLMLACTKIIPNDSYKTVHMFLEHGALVNFENKDGWTALHIICREGDIDILKCLLNYNLDVFKITKNFRTALHIACLHGHLEIVELLCNFNLDVNFRDKCGNTPLHEAVLGKSLPVFRFLITRTHINLEEKNNSDLNILYLAASVGCLDIIKCIVKELNFNVNVTNNLRLTPLHCAAKQKQLKAFELLIEFSADENIKDKFGRVARDYLYL